MAKKKPPVFITKTLLKEESFSELDFDLYEEFNVDTDHDQQMVELERKGSGSAEGNLIRLDVLVLHLEKMRQKGVTHVSLSHDWDHHGYELDGYELRLSTPKEIARYEANRQANLKTQAAMAQADRTRKELVKSLRNETNLD